MGVLGLAESQRARKRIDSRGRRADAAALLEPDVPVDADASELGDFLAPQARRAPPAARRQAHDLGAQFFPARAQEIAQFALSCRARRQWGQLRLGGFIRS